jgi:hypothetical protein
MNTFFFSASTVDVFAFPSLLPTPLVAQLDTERAGDCIFLHMPDLWHAHSVADETWLSGEGMSDTFGIYCPRQELAAGHVPVVLRKRSRIGPFDERLDGRGTDLETDILPQHEAKQIDSVLQGFGVELEDKYVSISHPI